MGPAVPEEERVLAAAEAHVLAREVVVGCLAGDVRRGRVCLALGAGAGLAQLLDTRGVVTLTWGSGDYGRRAYRA